MEKLRSASVPHIKFEIPRKPFPHFSVHTRVMQCGWKHSGKFALYFSVLFGCAILVPYTISLANGEVRPILPLLSLSGTESPQSGIYSICLYITAIIGFVMVCVRYVHVSSENESKDWRLNVLNKVGVTCGLASFVGIIVVAAFPVDHQVQQNPEKWVSSLMVPHMLGAFLVFFFGAMYLLFQTSISLFYYKGNSRIVCLRFTLFLMCGVCFAASTLARTKAEVNSKSLTDIFLQGDVIAKSLKKTATPSLTSSVFEWLMVFFFALYFLTFAKESQRLSVAITFRHLITSRRISIASITNMSKI